MVKKLDKEILKSPVIGKLIDLAIVTAPAWAWILLHPIAWEVDKKYPGTGLSFNAIYTAWVASDVLTRAAPLIGMMAAGRAAQT